MKKSLTPGLRWEEPKPGAEKVPAQYLVLVRCRDERQQVELLERFAAKGVECKALVA